jgi:hypothetical protein
MNEKQFLKEWLVEALDFLKGSGTIVEVCEIVWKLHESDLKLAGDLYYTWQYDIRWAATKLRKDGIIEHAELSPKGVWELVQPYSSNLWP